MQNALEPLVAPVLDAAEQHNVVVLDAEVDGLPRAELVDTAALLPLLARVSPCLLYVQRHVLDARAFEGMEERVRAALQLLEEDVDTGDSEETPSEEPWEVEAAQRLTVAAANAQAALDACQRYKGQVGEVDLTALVCGVAHDVHLSAAWQEQLDEAFDELAEAVAVLDDPSAGLSPQEQDRQWDQARERRHLQDQQRLAEADELGERLHKHLRRDRSFQSIKAKEERWRYAVATLRTEFGRPDLRPDERGQLRPHAERAWELFRDEDLPALKEDALASLVDSPEALIRRQEWTAGTKRDRESLLKSYLTAIHPMLADRDTIQQALRALSTSAGGQAPLLL